MAGAGYLLFTAGQVLTAAQVNTYLNQQAVMVFATTAARDSALTSVKSEGMVTYQLDNNDLDIYNGSSFSTLVSNAHGALTQWTPTLTQSATPTVTFTSRGYQRMGRWVQGYCEINITSGTGTASNAVVMGLPVAHALGANTPIGTGMLYDQSATSKYRFILVAGATSVTARGYETPNLSDIFTGIGTFAAALAVNDYVAYQFAYECSADA